MLNVMRFFLTQNKVFSDYLQIMSLEKRKTKWLFNYQKKLIWTVPRYLHPPATAFISASYLCQKGRVYLTIEYKLLDFHSDSE